MGAGSLESNELSRRMECPFISPFQDGKLGLCHQVMTMEYVTAPRCCLPYSGLLTLSSDLLWATVRTGDIRAILQLNCVASMEILRCGSHTSRSRDVQVCAVKGFRLKMSCSPEHNPCYLEYPQLMRLLQGDTGRRQVPKLTTS